MNDVLKELISLEEKCATYFNQKNIPEILKHFADDVSGFSSTEHDRFKGIEELKKTFEYYLTEAETVSYEIIEPEASRFGNTAILSFYWRVTLKTGKKRVEIPGRGSHIYHLIDGEWKIVHEHFSRAH